VLRNLEVAIKTIRLLSERLAACEGRLSDLIRKQVIARLAGLILLVILICVGALGCGTYFLISSG
jgi:hypothetical protein